MNPKFDFEDFKKKSQKLINFCIILMLIGSVTLVTIIGIMICCSPITNEPWRLLVAFITFLGAVLFFVGLLMIGMTKLELWLMKKILKIKKEEETNQSENP